MRLTELEPRYFTRQRDGHPIGITFDCPHCQQTRLAIAIHLDGTNMDPEPDNPQCFETDEHVWTIAGGDGFGNLSLSPSIDASKHGHWHGFITNGDTTP